MNNWKECAVPDSYVKSRIGQKNQIPAQDIREHGRYPVIDQGQKFIAGFCDDDDKLIDFDLPVIIFGDHTRCFKYVDFPFILGADGTKVLLPNKDLYNPKFYYFALLSLTLPSRGYNRHFKILKERTLPLPPLSEQARIAEILSTVQKAIKEQEQIIRTTTELKKALMQKLFTEGLRGEKRKMTEVGLVPESWEVVKLGEIARLQTGGTPSRKEDSYWNGGTIPWVKTGEIAYKIINKTEESITEKGRQESNAKLFPKGTLLMAMYGQGITRGRVGILGIDATTNQACAAITPLDEKQIRTSYLYYFFEFFYEELRSRGHGANQKNLSTTLLKVFPIAFPNVQDQADITQLLSASDRKINTIKAKIRSTHALFESLLHELMTGTTKTNTIRLNEHGADSHC